MELILFGLQVCLDLEKKVYKSDLIDLQVCFDLEKNKSDLISNDKT